ncbi:uncharacterized protein EDB93DRAFT_1247276 [Suillus bovinus]|uniref:uncharacterized protein n=1 Tax=Suillus bovinus TaxID=48563 RepID=UPI001B886F21|nr:uncharacterized protein EDB93DRAFT_1247276 [Suillus bovinus]KAG2156566.1 hypothetical protein EDB93DRAFT_1247276 [Suillus bovinus]
MTLNDKQLPKNYKSDVVKTFIFGSSSWTLLPVPSPWWSLLSGLLLGILLSSLVDPSLVDPPSWPLVGPPSWLLHGPSSPAFGGPSSLAPSWTFLLAFFDGPSSLASMAPIPGFFGGPSFMVPSIGGYFPT